jgi:hypothetical protein
LASGLGCGGKTLGSENGRAVAVDAPEDEAAGDSASGTTPMASTFAGCAGIDFVDGAWLERTWSVSLRSRPNAPRTDYPLQQVALLEDERRLLFWATGGSVSFSGELWIRAGAGMSEVDGTLVYSTVSGDQVQSALAPVTLPDVRRVGVESSQAAVIGVDGNATLTWQLTCVAVRIAP